MAKKSHQSHRSLGLALFFLSLTLGSVFILKKSLFPKCANSLSCKESLEFSIANGEPAVFSGQTIIPPFIELNNNLASSDVLAVATEGQEKHIFVDLATQTLTAVEGETIFMQVPVSTGKWGRTPTGDFTIWSKVRSSKMSGGSGNDYYYLPNVPYIMFFEGSGVSAGRGFSLHGTYWHNNFGHPMSHGCVNMRIIDAEKLFSWANPQTAGHTTAASEDNPGTKITIYGEIPS
ncbi:hypothetical protein A2382_02915 [Candidatus Woesebacteria bacterium RIFOXYB1_FULL_38_16]|uniref:L,D-TPase catalytic domain-containing protein n=1 Tax=Candidatus Woesebacteria bacterium RIFOXYB1_FULL_38_16 TaxID=1802538 RepID=A0A1F8CTU5_9BACT|nr:MAG: hypothetical protein A2191_04760 [Candidatus Woesebacteria bacterium RIFOXYA1_FULL_38_9]OGM79158.1 MAG: hypothetical protein A2382_02915 [Candidatus Woesebacteria bacterium RIFOXYB1_FULL_38_16]